MGFKPRLCECYMMKCAFVTSSAFDSHALLDPWLEGFIVVLFRPGFWLDQLPGEENK